MKSSIKIDFIDRGTGIGIEPVIRVELIKSEDPRDTLISYLFESIQYQSFLQLTYSNHKPIASGGLSDFEKQILLFKPEVNTDLVTTAAYWGFRRWLADEEYKISGTKIVRGEESYTSDELFKKFLDFACTETPNQSVN